MEFLVGEGYEVRGIKRLPSSVSTDRSDHLYYVLPALIHKFHEAKRARADLVEVSSSGRPNVSFCTSMTLWGRNLRSS